MNDDYLSVTQVAQLKGLSRNAVYKAIQEGRLPSVRIAGVAIRRSDALAWIPRLQMKRRQGNPVTEEVKAKRSAGKNARHKAKTRPQKLDFLLIGFLLFSVSFVHFAFRTSVFFISRFLRLVLVPPNSL